MIIDLNSLNGFDKQHYLQHIIAPRPVCFASTVNREDIVNLSPFSFFNLFSTNPPVVIFSPARRVRNNTTKHTLENVLEVPEVAINIVDYAMVQQTSLASCEYDKGVNEFQKAGFTMQPSSIIKPPLVKESKAKMECRVLEVKTLGSEGGAGNLVICEVLLLHLDDAILDADKRVDQQKINQVARLGGDWYCKVDEQNLFKVPKPNIHLGVGVDALPASIKNSFILSGNDLGMLANVTVIPQKDATFSDDYLDVLKAKHPKTTALELLHLYAKKMIIDGAVDKAWQILLAADSLL
ncbi:flavin reductase family protein [Niabella soli]|uniref:Flavin reductase n=1 Tax=Niabella soli DSM 19437 TaxID=929713 RepID=W0F0T8_9BACT|nr:flavin reductase family protein [Niabella soli]AHF14956.1 flavin reductase [Niabella soli DSM 19437]